MLTAITLSEENGDQVMETIILFIHTHTHTYIHKCTNDCVVDSDSSRVINVLSNVFVKSAASWRKQIFNIEITCIASIINFMFHNDSTPSDLYLCFVMPSGV